MKVKLTRACMIGSTPRKAGESVDLPAADARRVIWLGFADEVKEKPTKTKGAAHEG